MTISAPIRPTKPQPIFWIAALLALCVFPAELAAQCPAEEPISSLERYELPPELPADPPLDSREACPSWRWIAVKAESEADCPRPETAPGSSWEEARHLFDDPRPPALEPFCLYEVQEGDEEARRQMNRNLESLLSQGRLLEVESGCAAVAPSASNDPGFEPPPTWRILHDQFYEHARAMPGWRHERSHYPAPACGPAVRVAVIDTQPTNDLAADRNSDHGYALSQLIRRLTCHQHEDGSDLRHCTADVHERLALPITDFSWASPKDTVIDTKRGGYFGTIDQLAVAVWKELRAWHETGESHLVMNLSVGWVGERFGGLEEGVHEMPVPVRSLYRTLEVASCRGALALAAAGNLVGGPTAERGPLLPGGWERRPAPTASECRRILGEGHLPQATPPEPLLYAVGGVHADHSTLANARPQSEPARVAYADHAVLLPEDERLAEFFTGSSVSTAVVSAAAASVWHHRPELGRSELMQLLHRSGRTLQRAADVYLGVGSGAPAPPVQVVGICPALAEACAKPRACPEIGEVSCADPLRPATLRTDCDAIDCARAKPHIIAFDEVLGNQSYCGHESLHYESDRGQPDFPCPGRQSFGIHAKPWTGPQPTDDPCVGCTLDPPVGPGSFRGGETESVGLAGSTGYRLTIPVDPPWCKKIRSAVFVLAGKTYDLDIANDLGPCPANTEEAPPVLVVYDGFAAQDVESQAHPRPVIQWHTTEGSVMSPVFVNR